MLGALLFCFCIYKSFQYLAFFTVYTPRCLNAAMRLTGNTHLFESLKDNNAVILEKNVWALNDSVRQQLVCDCAVSVVLVLLRIINRQKGSKPCCCE